LSEKEDYVCKLKKSLYVLKKKPRAWYRRLDKYLQQQGLRRGSTYSNLYIKVEHDNLTIIEVYVDDIIFRSDDDRLSKKFSKDMQSEFEMSLLGELTFLLGLQISRLDEGIFISQTKYIKEMILVMRVSSRRKQVNITINKIKGYILGYGLFVAKRNQIFLL
jgi:hypothetical protein